MLRNALSCIFASFLIVLLTPFINKPDSLRDLTTFIISSISSFEIINVVTADAKIFFSIPASATDAAAVNSNGIKALLANDLSTFFAKGKPVFNNGPRSVPKYPPNCTILDSLHWLSNYVLKLYEILKLVYWLIIIYAEN